MANDACEPVKDEDAAHPIARVWRPTLCEVIKAFVHGDYGLANGIPCVAAVDTLTAHQIRDYVVDYGETLAEAPEAIWETSVAQWMRTHWVLIVDLWTIESGRSDLVLSARVFEEHDDFRIVIDSVHVP